eukprot:COSAG01_NODE_42152_length_442_cov_0.561047_2_plen_23_part_01
MAAAIIGHSMLPIWGESMKVAEV